MMVMMSSTMMRRTGAWTGGNKKMKFHPGFILVSSCCTAGCCNCHVAVAATATGQELSMVRMVIPKEGLYCQGNSQGRLVH
eukprot:10428587-Karenia_brevis.AAC.1